MAAVREYINTLPLDATILDLACGEGVLVEEFRQKGRNIQGLDLNYANDYVCRGDARELPFSDGSFDAVLFLDALEHLSFEDQTKALSEIYRTLKLNGYLLLSVPNLTHLNSRVSFFFKGALDRTDRETDHVGERPVREYESLLNHANFEILGRRGLTFTLPYVYRNIVCKNPAKYRWVHDALEPLAKLFPSLAMIVLFVCRKRGNSLNYRNDCSGQDARIGPTINRSHIDEIFTHLTNTEKKHLTKLSRSLPSETPVIVEIGSYLGASACFLATGIEEKRGRVYAIDTWTNIGMTEGQRDTYEEFRTHIEPLKEYIEPLRGRSIDIAHTFDEEVDLLFVDGDHSYEAVRSDLEAWLPKVKDNGIVVLHDFSWADGVRQAVRELVFPLQREGAHRLETLYWTRIGKRAEDRDLLHASVIIPTRGRRKYLSETIRSVFAQDLPHERFEVILVDNNDSEQGLRGLVESLAEGNADNVYYVKEPSPGLLAGRHRGAKEAQGDILVFIDDDVVVDKGWLRSILDTFKDPAVHLVGGKNLPLYEKRPPSWLEGLWETNEHGRWCYYLSLLDFGSEIKDIDPVYIFGLNFAIRKHTLTALGGFHPDGVPWKLRRYRGDGETGLTAMAKEIGLKSVYQPAATVYHRVPPERVKRKYFMQRAYLQGISDSYARARSTFRIDDVPAPSFRRDWKLPARIVKERIKYLFSGVWTSSYGRIRDGISRAYKAGYSYHQNEVRNDPELLKWVLKEDYWDYRLP